MISSTTIMRVMDTVTENLMERIFQEISKLFMIMLISFSQERIFS